MSVSYGGDSITFADNSVVSSGWTGFKNRIINGAMVIDQRRSGSANNAPTSENYVTDRFLSYATTANKLIVQQVNGSNTSASNYESGGAPVGFTNSLKITANGGISLGTTEAFSIRQRIEGFNVDDLGWGTSDAKTITLSFWVKSSNTGYYSVALYNSAASSSYVSDYQVTQANTWEKKTITVTGPTSGTWLKQTAIAIQVHFDLGNGSNYKTGTINSWLSGTYLQSSSSNSLAATNGTTLYITGVQFEVGSTASSFEYRPYGTELALCQRYYQKWLSPGQIYFVTGHVWSTTLCQYAMLLNPPMRGHPSLGSGGTLTNLSGQSSVTLSSISLDAASTYADPGKTIKINGNMSSSSYTSGYSCALLINSNGAYLSLDSEL